MLKEYTFPHVLTLVDNVIHGDGVEQPSHRIMMIAVGISINIIFVCPSVTLDIDVEHLFDNIPHTDEGTSCDGIAVAETGVHPMFVNVLQGHSVMAQEGIRNPGVHFKEFFCWVCSVVVGYKAKEDT